MNNKTEIARLTTLLNNYKFSKEETAWVLQYIERLQTQADPAKVYDLKGFLPYRRLPYQDPSDKPYEGVDNDATRNDH